MTTRSRAKILLVDDDASLRRVTSYHLEHSGYDVHSLESAEAALAWLENASADLVLTDVRMAGMDGLELLRRLKAHRPSPAVVVFTAHGSVEDAVEAMREGAHDYLLKPFEHEALILSVDKALRVHELEAENLRLRELANLRLGFENLIGESEAMNRLLAEAAQVAPRDVTVLLHGESGTGKELLARAIHHASGRRNADFVAVAIGALPVTLVESELFGHRRGAFTGAERDRKGRFELAHGGTLFLDEIGDLPLASQVKLLRVLQERQVDPLGTDAPVEVDVRVIAATHRDLRALVERGDFREDLYYRLAVVPLELPPLRERGRDVLALARDFLRRIAARHDQPPADLTPRAEEALLRHRWPGNVRELENAMERALALRPQGPVDVDVLPAELRGATPDPGDFLGPLPEGGIDLEAIEKEILRRALERCGGNQSATARFLAISRNTLLYRMEKFGLR